MPQSTHDRAAELHNLAAHAHTAAAVAHGKGDHLTAHELSKQAQEHSMNARHPPTMGGERQWSFQLPTTGLPADFGSKSLLPDGHFTGLCQTGREFRPASGV